MAWNRVRWQALRGLMKQGIKPSEIDGGLEFNGWYLYNAAYKSTPEKSWWWVMDDTYLAGASVISGYRLFQQHPVNTWFPVGYSDYIYWEEEQTISPSILSAHLA